MRMSELTGNWNYPTNIRAGAGRIKELADACQVLGMKSPLLITDPGLANLPMVKEALENCQKEGLNVGLFSNIQGNPTGKNIEDGVNFCQKGQYDGVIAFGGGSALDAAKAIALMVGQDRPLWDYEDVGDNFLRVNESGMIPVVAVPTTAGTGSEVGRASVITDTEKQLKKIIFHPKMLPEIVILDPELTLGLPPNITAATGMDALSHNLEALCSPFYHPMAEGIAMEGVRLIKENLQKVVLDGSDVDARMQMLLASTMGATAFQKGLGAMHAIAHSLGALYGAHHGLLNAILMPYVLKENRYVIEARMERLARYINLTDTSFDGLMTWVLLMRTALNIPHTLADINITTEDAERVGSMSFADPCAGGNPIQFTVEKYQKIFVNAVNGKLI